MRTYAEYSTFNWQDPWFADDRDAQIRSDGVFLNGGFRGDGITVDGLKEQPARSRATAIRPVRPLGTPRVFLLPRS